MDAKQLILIPACLAVLLAVSGCKDKKKEAEPEPTLAERIEEIKAAESIGEINTAVTREVCNTENLLKLKKILKSNKWDSVMHSCAPAMTMVMGHSNVKLNADNVPTEKVCSKEYIDQFKSDGSLDSGAPGWLAKECTERQKAAEKK